MQIVATISDSLSFSVKVESLLYFSFQINLKCLCSHDFTSAMKEQKNIADLQCYL
jgi:hypothetical protein